MNLINSFLLATAFCYVTCLAVTLIGAPPMTKWSKTQQSVFYISAFAVILFVVWNPSVTWLNFVLGIVYSFAAMTTFIGWPHTWKAYWTSNPGGGSAAQQVMMSAWDLALAVIFFSLV